MFREFKAFILIVYIGDRNDVLWIDYNASIASDDDQIKAHKWKWVAIMHTMKTSWGLLQGCNKWLQWGHHMLMGDGSKITMRTSHSYGWWF